MTLAKKGLRTIQVGGKNFVWKVRRKVSHEEKYEAQLAIPIQYSAGGQLLIAYVEYSRSGYEAYGISGTGKLKKITPAIIEACIAEALNLGWQYASPGKPVCILNGKLAEDTFLARWQAS